MALEPSSTVDEAMLRSPQTERRWLLPFPDARLDLIQNPEDVVVERDTIRLAFVAALQHLPARQRAVLLLRDVVRLRASEVAQALGTTVAAVNSAHQRARATLASCDLGEPDDRLLGPAERRLLAKYVAAFERYDLSGIAEGLKPAGVVTVRATADDGKTTEFEALVRIDTPGEADYYRHGGIMQFVLRSLLV